jgi:hypothetical protein
MAQPTILIRLQRAGMVYPYWTWRQAKVARLGLPLACALLMQESAGGHNEFGHDPTIAVGWGTVTKAKYLAYRKLRDEGHGCQGVGPCQLTAAGYQDEADRLGGCWIPRLNCAVGFHALHGLVAAHGLQAGVAAYNGSGPAAERYSQRVLALAAHFKEQKCGTLIGVW